MPTRRKFRLRLPTRTLALGERTLLMGVVNVTPDSFSDGGLYLETEAAVRHALALEQAGADILDIGGESTRPGAEPTPPEVELDRVVPVLERLRGRVKIPISIDTRRAEVADMAARAGVEIIHDVSALRECVAAGEPLNPEVIEQVRRAWGITVRDGYGQTETTAQVGNSPGQPVKPGSMGRPLPGYTVVLVDPVSGEPAGEGEICLDLSERPLGLMTGYRSDPERDAEAMRGGYYHTGDVASRDEDGYLTYIGRTDDVFKASDYRISPFELESVLIEHEAVAEAAVVPSPDPMRLAVPKAYIALIAGAEPTPETALSILAYARERLAPYKRVRRLEFSDLPKTISGKIRRVELREQETGRLGPRAPAAQPGIRGVTEFWEEDFPGLKG